MHLPAELCKMQKKKRETDGFSKSIWMTPPGSHPTSGFGARHGLPKFFRHKKTPHRTKRCGKNESLPGRHSYWLGPAHEATAHWADCLPCLRQGRAVRIPPGPKASV